MPLQRQRRRDFAWEVHAVVGEIPEGRVLTYGDVAALCGSPRAARGVGSALRGLPHDTAIPWWRVINAQGRISLPGAAGTLQRKLLRREGIRFRDGAVDLGRYRWDAC